jgi:hypothetical protein
VKLYVRFSSIYIIYIIHKILSKEINVSRLSLLKEENES